jgi:uncharacterized protein YqfB (UPF0267 family)
MTEEKTMEYKLQLNTPKALGGKSKNGVDQAFLKDIAIGLWRLKRAIETEYPNRAGLPATRTWKNLERQYAMLRAKGITIQDKTGEAYDPGMMLRVVSAEPRADLKREFIIETVTPTVLYQGNILHAGEVIIGKPACSGTTLETNLSK